MVYSVEFDRDENGYTGNIKCRRIQEHILWAAKIEISFTKKLVTTQDKSRMETTRVKQKGESDQKSSR